MAHHIRLLQERGATAEASVPGFGKTYVAAFVAREVLRQAPAGFSAATKCFCTEHEQRVAQFASRVLGMETTLWTEWTKDWLYFPGYTIMGGTSNVMRNILGERVLGLAKG